MTPTLASTPLVFPVRRPLCRTKRPNQSGPAEAPITAMCTRRVGAFAGLRPAHFLSSLTGLGSGLRSSSQECVLGYSLSNLSKLGFVEAAGETAGPSTSLRSGRDDNSVAESTTAPSHLFRSLQNCHPDRSVAKWRDLQCALRLSQIFPRRQSRMHPLFRIKPSPRNLISQWMIVALVWPIKSTLPGRPIR